MPSIRSPLILSADVIYKIADSDTASKPADLGSYPIDLLMIQFYKPCVPAFFFPNFGVNRLSSINFMNYIYVNEKIVLGLLYHRFCLSCFIQVWLKANVACNRSQSE